MQVLQNFLCDLRCEVPTFTLVLKVAGRNKEKGGIL